MDGNSRADTADTAPVPSAATPAETARAAYSVGDYDSAASLYQQAISGGQDTAENHQYLGMALFNLGRKAESITHFNRAVQLYLDRKAKGIDPSAAESGIRTCKTYIELARR